MDLVAVILFLVLYFVRFHDWVPGLAGLNVIKPVIALGILGLLSRPVRSPAWRSMTTPHEWLMLVYLLHGIYVSHDWIETFKVVLPVAAFFMLTAQTLTSEDRLDRFFAWWAGCVSFMCVLGLLTEMGIDITQARDLMDEKLGRLCLNTYLLDNPNAMGHTAVTAYPLIYFTMIFRRGVGPRLMSIPLLMAVTSCVVATESKGAYLSGAAAISAALLVGRGPIVQIVLASLLIAGGSAATSMLPRMVNKEQLRYDEGVMGRAMAFQNARTAYETTPAGWNSFTAEFKWEGKTVNIASHSSIVQVGGDQGPIGLFLFMSILALSARTVFTSKTDSDVLDRARRLIFALVVGYYVSGWMINRSYHTEFFLLSAAAVVCHKLCIEQRRLEAGLTDAEGLDKIAEPKPVPTLLATKTADGGVVIEEREFIAEPRRFWHRYTFVDFGLGYGLWSFSLWLWTYIVDYFVTP
jgi:hypothetical protein